MNLDWNTSPWNEAALSNPHPPKHLSAAGKDKLQGLQSKQSDVYTQRINNPNGDANSHSLFTGFSALNLTYCYIYTNRHKWMHFTITLRQQQRRQGDPILQKWSRHKTKGSLHKHHLLICAVSTRGKKAEWPAMSSKKMLIPPTEWYFEKSKSLLFPKCGRLSQRRNILWEKDEPWTNHESRVDTWLSVLPSGVCNNLGRVTASASRQGKDGPYLSGPQLINLKSEIEKKFYKAL